MIYLAYRKWQPTSSIIIHKFSTNMAQCKISKRSIRELFKRTRKAKSALPRYENNKRFSRINVLENIAATFDVPITDLIEADLK